MYSREVKGNTKPDICTIFEIDAMRRGQTTKERIPTVCKELEGGYSSLFADGRPGGQAVAEAVALIHSGNPMRAVALLREAEFPCGPAGDLGRAFLGLALKAALRPAACRLVCEPLTQSEDAMAREMAIELMEALGKSE